MILAEERAIAKLDDSLFPTARNKGLSYLVPVAAQLQFHSFLKKVIFRTFFLSETGDIA